MKNTYGNSVSITIFGESHGSAIGCVLDGLAPGIPVDENFIKEKLSLRRPSGGISTARREPDEFIIHSGVYEGKTTGTPICILIPNTDTKSRDYSSNLNKARPGHADYTAFMKYHGFEDTRGGGHFSGRITAALVAAGAICYSALLFKGIKIGTHIKFIAGVEDRDFQNLDADISSLQNKEFAVLSDTVAKEMIEKIMEAAREKDSVGGILETVVTGVPSGVGEPWFDTVEGRLSYALFSIPALKGVGFGEGFGLAKMKGSEANDEYYIDNGDIKTSTNNNGGILGGITNGMPITFKCVIKPTPSIGKVQKTVNYISNEETDIEVVGRHDPCIVQRARAVVDAVTAITLCDLLSERFSTDWLGEE